MKNKQTKKSTLESLPKEIRDRVVTVGTGIPLSGTINHTFLNGNSGTIGYGENGLTNKQMFPNPTTTIPKSSEQKEEVKESNDITISVNYGTSGSSIKNQLKAQGFKFDKDFIKGCEEVRIELLSLIDIDILTIKQGQKAFLKLNTMVSNNVIEMTFGDVKSKIKKTFINNKEVK
jgi:hypothetical protein